MLSLGFHSLVFAQTKASVTVTEVLQRLLLICGQGFGRRDHNEIVLPSEMWSLLKQSAAC